MYILYFEIESNRRTNSTRDPKAPDMKEILVYKILEIFHSRLPLKIYQAHAVFHMAHRTLRDRDAIPPALKTIPSSSLSMGEPVLSVFVAGNDTVAWKDKKRR